MAPQTPVTLVVCMGSSCFSRGNNSNLVFVQNFLKERGLEDSVQLVGSRCEGECLHGPNLRVNGKLINGAMPELLPDILEAELKAALGTE